MGVGEKGKENFGDRVVSLQLSIIRVRALVWSAALLQDEAVMGYRAKGTRSFMHMNWRFHHDA